MGVVGDARAAKIDCDTSESSSEARFCDFVNLRELQKQKQIIRISNC